MCISTESPSRIRTGKIIPVLCTVGLKSIRHCFSNNVLFVYSIIHYGFLGIPISTGKGFLNMNMPQWLNMVIPYNTGRLWCCWVGVLTIFPILELFYSQKHFLENIWRRRVDQKPNNNFASNNLWIFALFQSYFQKYESSRRYFLKELWVWMG